ncbi:hypothetical protein XENOCAPTIV_020571 [Xenoophorus captivus]|uniref:Uncharacterized protein n=1 Tax=Xenoophorus captivus TaxID=1517983 RepID=A0ABV0RK08_9TELE
MYPFLSWCCLAAWLIVLGLKHFEGADQTDQLISSYLLCKSRWNIRKRIREMSGPRAPQGNVIKVPRQVQKRLFILAHNASLLPLAKAPTDQPVEQRVKQKPVSRLSPPPPGVELLSDSAAVLGPLSLALSPFCGTVPLTAVHPRPSNPICHDVLGFGFPVGQNMQQKSAPFLLPLNSLSRSSSTTPIMSCSAPSRESGHFLLQMVWTPPVSCSTTFSHHAIGPESLRPVGQEHPKSTISPYPPCEEEAKDSSPSTLSPFSSSAGDKEEEQEEDWSVMGETMKQLTWLAAERRLCNGDSEDDHSPTSQEDEDEEDDETKGEEPEEGRSFKTSLDKEMPSGEKTAKGRRSHSSPPWFGEDASGTSQKLRCILGDHTDLLRDFAAFLLPEQALLCGLLKAQMGTLLKGHTHLQAEFWVFFDDLRPPLARPEQFEDAYLPEEAEGGEGGGQVSGGGASGSFEEVKLPDLEEEEDGHEIRPITSRRQRRKMESHRSYKVCRKTCSCLR